MELLAILFRLACMGLFLWIMFAIHPLLGVLAIASSLGFFNGRTVIVRERV